MNNMASIRDTCKNCNLLFAKILNKPHAAGTDTIEALHERFKAWTWYLGVFADENLSLDTRLKYSESIAQIIQQFLQIAVQALDGVEKIDRAEVETNDAFEEDLRRFVAADLDLSIKMGILSPLSISLNAVNSALDGLDRIGTALRQSSSSSLNHRISNFGLQNAEETIEELVYIQLKRKFFDRNLDRGPPVASRSSLSLCRLLATSISFRHLRLLYRQHRQERFAGTPIAAPVEITVDVTDSDQVPKEVQQGKQPAGPVKTTEKTNQPNLRKQAIANAAMLQSAQDAPSSVNSEAVRQRLAQTSGASVAASSVISQQLDGVKYPDPPEADPKSRLAKCPYCGKPHTEKQLEKKNWRNHLRDCLKLYTCLSEDCAEPPQHFARFYQWRDHMDKHHSRDWLVEFHQPLQWCCDLDHKHSGEIFFDEEEEYDQHFKEEHHGLQNESDVLKLRSKLRKIRPDYTCLICSMIPKKVEHVIPSLEGKVSGPSAAAGKARSPDCARKELIHHIGVHLKSFGLAYLAYFRDDAEGKSLNSKQGSIAIDKDEMRYPVENDPDYLDEQFKDYQTPEEPSMDTVHEDWLFIDYLKVTDWSVADDTIYRHFDKHQPRPHESRYKRTGDMADLEAAIRAAQQAVDSTPEDHPDRAIYLNGLGSKLSLRYERTGNMAELDSAIQVLHQAVDSTSADHPDWAGRLNNFGSGLSLRYKRTGNIADLERAIQVSHQALDSTPDDHPDRAIYLNSLGYKLSLRYERTGNTADLESAIRVVQEAVDLTPDDHPDQAIYLNSLGSKLSLRYERTSNMADLESAIQVLHQAVDWTLTDHPDRAGRLNNLGTGLSLWYERTSNMADLESAIQVSHQALDSTPDDHPDRAIYLNSLGYKLSLRYELTGDIADLESAIQVIQQAVDLTLDDHPDQAIYLNSLGSKLKSRYERTGNIADLENAIRVVHQALDSTPVNHPDWAGRLNNFGSGLSLQYERTGDIANLKSAIQVVQQAVDLTPDNHPDRAIYLNSLGSKLKSRYEQTGDIADLENAIRVVQRAVDLTPDDHPDRAIYLNSLGSKLESRYERTSDMTSLEKSSSFFIHAWKCENSVPFRRIQAASRAVNVLGMLGSLESAAQLAQGAIDLLPTVSNRSLARSDQQYAVSYFSGLAASACSIYLQLDQPEQALEILEKGRAVILGQLIGDRCDISILSKTHPEIAGRFKSLRNEINAPLSSQDGATHLKHAQQRRHDCIVAFESCVQDIRNILGYERFLASLTPDEMRVCASKGPIVIVNVTDLGSHAIIVTPSEIKSLDLPKFSSSEARRWLNQQWGTGRENIGLENKEFRTYLAWLWHVCAKEVLDNADFRVQQSRKDLPRIWWIGTGLASTMPFHAAGDHAPKSERNVHNRAVSSYTPSIKALAYSRERLRKNDDRGENMLLATMTTTPGLQSLPEVEAEKETILKMLPGYLLLNVLDRPSTHDVLQSLERCSIAHFACHGHTDYADPSKSGLVFQKFDEAGRLVQDTMRVQSVSELKLESARIAYLSAASTAENGAARLRDEVIHLVSGFQIAGFAHVVGCLWPPEDAVCVKIAKGFYGTLFKGDVETVDKDVALALHEAVSAVREMECDQPLKWAQFVHYGA